MRLSWSELLCGEGAVVAVAGVVGAFVFLPQVKAPVWFEVAVGDEGAELEDGFGAVQAVPLENRIG